jgi:hypothetical protein
MVAMDAHGRAVTAHDKWRDEIWNSREKNAKIAKNKTKKISRKDAKTQRKDKKQNSREKAQKTISRGEAE